MRLAIIPDFAEEGWPSMDLVAEMLLRETGATRLLPTYRRRFAWVPRLGRNADRLLNRHLDLPRYLQRRARDFDAYHVADHSYAQAVHALPAERTGVFCHDLDAFRCLLEPEREPRPAWFRAMARRVLDGMRRAAIVFHSTSAVREAIERHGLVDPSRLVAAPYGVAEEFVAEGPTNSQEPYLLHVGSCISRKRIDVLLDAFAAVRAVHPALRLVKVGGEWTRTQQEQIDRLGLRGAIDHRVNLDRAEVAKLYRASELVLQPSDAEGFGLPIIEALACGAPVVASDLPVLREVGGDAAAYLPVGDAAAWGEAVRQFLEAPDRLPSRASRLERASRYTWKAHAATILAAYRRLIGGTP